METAVAPARRRPCGGSCSHVFAADEAVERPAAREEPHVDAVRDEAAARLPLVVLIPGELREAHLLREEPLLPAGELELRVAQRLQRDLHLLLLRADRDQGRADADARRRAVGFP